MIAKILDDCGGYRYAIVLDELKTYSALVNLKNSLSEMLFFATGQQLQDDNINCCFGSQMWDCLALLSAIDLQTTITEQEAAGRFGLAALDLPQYKETR